MKRKGLLIICLVMVLVLSLGGACAKPAPVEPIKIGVLIDFIGVASDYGPKFQVLQELYLEEIGWEVAGRPIELFTEDTATDPAVALDKARKLVGVDKVHMLIGTIMGTISVPMALFAAENKIPHIIWLGGHYEAVERGWSFATTLPLETSTYAAGLYAYDKGHRTAIAIGQDYIAGHKFVGGAMQAFIDRGGKVIQKQWVPLGTKDFAPYLGAMETADVCFFWFGSIYAPMFMNQFEEFGLLKKMPLVITEGDSLFTEHLQVLGPQFEGQVSGRTTYTSSIDTPENKKFVAAFKAKTGAEPDAYDLAAYECVMLAIAAFEATGGDTDPEKLRQAIRGITMATPAGSVRISQEGYAFRQAYIFELQLKDGEFARVPVRTYPEQELISLRAGIAP